MRILGNLGGVAVGLAVVIIFLLVNGGYVYRTKCPLASGGTQTKWTYGIDDILPYIRSTSAPCRSHTGTRLLLSAVGIAKIDDGGSNTAASNPTPADNAAADALATATSAITTEYDRERRVTSVLKAAIKTQGFTPALRRTYAGIASVSIARFRAIKKTLDRSRSSSDKQLTEGKRLVSLYLALQAEANLLFFTTKTTDELKTKSIAIASKLDPVIQRLQTLAVEIQSKYPNVTDWGFLPNS